MSAGLWSPLTTGWAVTSQSSARTGRPLDTVQNHHAASTSLMGTLQIMQPGGGRQVSSNYVVYKRQIIGVVPENRRAWTSGSWEDDDRSITMEIINSSGTPYWQFDPETVETVAALNADLARRYPRIVLRHALPGIVEHRNLYEWFGRSYPTACAGPSFNIKQVIARAVAINSGGSKPGRIIEEDDDMATEVFTKTEKGAEWMRTEPGLGPDLKAGESRKERVGSGVVVTRPGMQITTDRATGESWGRLHRAKYGNAPSRLGYDHWVGVQTAAEAFALELRGIPSYRPGKG